MGKQKGWSSKELIRAVEAAGWRHVRTNGSHHIFKRDGSAKPLSIPHPRRDLSSGLVRRILKDAGIENA